MLKQLHILAVLLLCGLMLIATAAGSICLCESSEKVPMLAELRAVSAAGDTVTATADENGYPEQEHSDCQDQNCFCCTSKLTRRLSFTLAGNEQEVALGEAYRSFLPDNAFPPLTPPPKNGLTPFCI